MSISIQGEIERCQREIAAVEEALLAGHPDVQGLCFALSDWSAELRILQAELAAGKNADRNEKSRQLEGQRLLHNETLLPESVDAVAVLGLRVGNREPHLAERAAEEPADTMLLPTSGFHHLRQRRALLPPEQREYLGFLAAVPGCFSFPGSLLQLGLGTLGVSSRRGRFLRPGGPFLPDRYLGRDLGTPLRNGGGLAVCRVPHLVVVSLLRLLRMMMDHSVRTGKQVESAHRRNS